MDTIKTISSEFICSIRLTLPKRKLDLAKTALGDRGGEEVVDVPKTRSNHNSSTTNN